jgi:FemAB-related protein (PEP-CTERM system-associated)
MPFLDGGGPCATSPALETKLIVRLLQEARRIGARVVEIRASRRLPIAAAPQEHKVNMVLPLTGSLDDVFSRIDRAARSQIRKAARSSLSIEIGGSEHIDTFYALFVERMRELGSPVHSKAFFDAIMEHFGDQARLIIARSGSQPVGGLFALASDDVLTVPWAASLRSHASLNTNMLLYWETIQAAHGLGFERFDFGRSTRDSGTYRFKRQWGAREEPLYWYSLPNAVNDVTHAAAEHDDSMSASAADFCVHMWQHLPLGLTRHLGPRVRKYLTQ